MSEVTTDYDNAWKQTLKVFFPDFMAFFFPAAHDDIEWARGYKFLDKELQQAARDAELGRRYADVLVQVWRQGGEEAWVLVHVEVQGQPQAEFAERMYVYNYRLYDYHRRHVASLAVLADEQASWRPSEFGYELWGCRVALAFPSVKLLDYRQQWSSLEESPNPFATVVMAHLKAQETRHDTAERQTWKLWLIRRLYQLGYDRQKIIGLYGFIDWVLQLAEPEASAFWHELREIEEEKGMPYVTSVERIGIQQGEAVMVLRVLDRRFGAVPSDLALRIRGLPDPQLLSLMDVVVTATTLPEVTAAVDALSVSAGDESPS